jgi:dTDP-4-amino-4,6-dideoxygalactose transaminase
MALIPFYKHDLDQTAVDSVKSTMDSPFLTTGLQTQVFEDQFAKRFNVQHGVGVSSCTLGLYIGLKALGIGPGDEVITTPMTFISTPNAILYTGATPVFVDVEPDTGNINAALIEAAITDKTKAIMPVHLYGQLCDMTKISEIAKQHGLAIVEDCAHAIESQRDGIRPGQKSDMAVFSFYATKNMTCGEGGCIITNNRDLSDLLQKYRLHGMTKNAIDRYQDRYQHWDMVLLGHKCNMNDIQASILLTQLPHIEDRLQKREALALHYEKGLTELGITYPIALSNSRHARHLFTFWAQDNRDEWLTKLQDEGIGVAVNYRAVHLLEYYKNRFSFKAGDFPEAERIGNCTITLPLYPKLTLDQVDKVVSFIRTIC